MEIHPLIDTQVDRGSAENEVLQWNATDLRWENRADLTIDGALRTDFIGPATAPLDDDLIQLAADEVTVNGDIDLEVDGTYLIGSLNALSFPVSSTNVAIGNGAGSSITSGTENLTIGSSAGNQITLGIRNVSLGPSAGFHCTDGNNNMCIGRKANWANTGGDENTIVGAGSFEGSSLFSRSRNTVIGFGVGQVVTTASDNTIIGYQAGNRITSGLKNLFLGKQAGFNQTTAENLLIIDNVNRGSTADEALESLIYGQFSTTITNQLLTINAATTIGNATNNQPLDVCGSLAVIRTATPELVINGDFDTDSDWTVSASGATQTIAGGEIEIVATSAARGSYQSFTTETGVTYEAVVESTVASTAHVLRCGNGTVPDAGLADSATSSVPATLTLTFTATSTSSYVYLRCSAIGTVSWDNVSVKKVTDSGDVDIDGYLAVGGNTSLGDAATDTHDIWGITTLGDGGTTNYSKFEADGTLKFEGTAAINGLKIQTTRITAATYTAIATDDDIFCNTDSNDITITLPAGIDGKKYRIINTGTGTVTVSPDGAETIVGSTTDVELNSCDILILTFEPTEGWW